MSVSITIDQTQKTLLYSRSSPFNVQCHRPNPSWDCSEWEPGLCRWVQPQTNPSWNCSRHFCDIPTYNVTDPIPAGIASRGTRLMPVSTATDQSQLGLLSSLL